MTEVKRGTLKFYHRGLFSKKWKHYYCILYDSSLLTWYADIKHKKPDGMVLLKDVERYLCVGPYTKYLPDFPQLDNESDEVALIAFPLTVKNRDRDIVWLQCQDIDDLNSWMKAIVQTLPSYTFRVDRLPNVSSSSLREQIQTETSLHTPSIETPEAIKVNISSVGLPLAAGLVGSRLQGYTMNAKENPLRRAGYDYGNTLWGTGEGWGYFTPEIVPGYAGFGGGGCVLNQIDSIRSEEEEEALTRDDNEAVEEATYEPSKNLVESEDNDGILIDDDDDDQDEEEDKEDKDADDENDEENEDDDMPDEMRMIDSDGDK